MVQAINTHEEAKAPEGHDEAMAAKVDQVNEDLERQAEGDALEEPQQKIAGKFDSVEDLEKAYKELEKKLGQPKEQQETPSENEAEKAVENAGLNMEDMSNYYEENGQLSDEHYEALEKSGIPREYVDAYIEGIEAQAQIHNDRILSQVGGAEQYAEMTEWAKANMNEREIDRYNRAIDTNDPEIMEQAIMGLAYRYRAEVGNSPKLLEGQGKGSSGGFDSVAQLTAAMSDPRYAKDPAYRRDVEQRLARSNIL